MRILLFFLLGTVSQASWPSKEGVAVPCGTTFDLNDFEQPDVEFESIEGVDRACTFHITATRGYHVELTCTGETATANGQDASNFHGPAPVLVVFTPANADSQLFCRAGIEEEHEDLGELHGKNGVDTNIKEFDIAFNIRDEKNQEYRSKILAQNIKEIEKINTDPSQTWNAGVTNMADKTIEDVVMFYTGLPPPPSQEEQDRQTERAERELLAPLRARRQALPSSVDLTSTGRVSPAKSQQSCGSCAAFASVSTIESCMARETGVLPTDLSEQHLMDCAYHYKNSASGCAGAWPFAYLEWMYDQHNGGLADESEYPYISASWGMVDRAGTCRNSSVPTADHGAVVTDSYHTWRATEDDIMQLLAEGRSVASSFKIESGYHLYRNRVYQHKNCQNWRTNSNYDNNRSHAVTIVGYGTQEGVPYWKFKNSWGSGWGDNGFQKILRGVGHCGFAMEFAVPYCTVTGTAPIPTPAPNPIPNPEGTCGGTLTASKGVILSEGYPRQYKPSQDCFWNIYDVSNALNKVVKFTIKDMDVEFTGTCSYDWVQFKNSDNSVISLGEGKAANEGKVCGALIPEPIFSKTNAASVRFYSDHKVQFKGFRIEYEIVEAVSCANVRLSTAIGVQPVTFTTLHYPSNYENNQKCEWTITVPPGQNIGLVFDTFNTEYPNDEVKVFDGTDANSGRLASLTGFHSSFLQYKSRGNAMHVTFKTDGSGTKKGFRATATAV
jgi:C1A family cysteine protease